ncbi:hypothetical protein CA51_30790 [Rosistilla oblonga]|uniref:hypothetical protein n=1 Tax=Rosistilla oblonga TaxID=2527990 RepID=UPI00118CD606|nr:hypothetical protein [Rosistilla oblonga]QDV13192.1 hypothetical protein CA51_30790 [Rosistilla oblonga]
MKRFCCILLLLFLSGPVAAQAFVPNLGPDLPSITVRCGEVTLKLRRHSQWTPARIDFRGTPMTTERSAYGTVFRFPEIGFIGTGHLENEPEELQSLTFYVDGKEVATPTAELSGETFRFVRESKIRGFRLTNVFEIKEDRLYETTMVAADVETPLDLVYHFMHAWTPTVSALVAGSDAKPEADLIQPLLNDDEVDHKFYINAAVDWMSVYEPGSQQFAVSRLLETPATAGSTSKVWNVVGTYRKYYLTAFQNQTVPKGFKGTWRMVTGFGEGDREQWPEAARKLASELSK